jgi:hypothetical protein
MSSKEPFGWVGCSNGRPLKDLKTRKFIRTHVMHRYKQQKRGTQNLKHDGQNHDAMALNKHTCPVASPERWSRDPFNSFPIDMQPRMHELLYLCRLFPPCIKMTTHSAETPLVNLCSYFVFRCFCSITCAIPS